MTWTIDNKSHLDKGISEYIERISSLTIDHISKRLNFLPPLGVKPITLIYDCKDGPIVYWPLKPDKYEIGLCINDIFPHKIIYQMAHELCHIYIDPRINGTFIEIICHKTAFDILEEIGATLTSTGQLGVDKYISDLRINAETQKQMTIAELDPQTLFDIIKELESYNILKDREYNDIIALKLKELIDPIDKFGIIKHIKNAIIPSPPQNISNLTTNAKTKINLNELIKSVAKNNIILSETLTKLKNKNCE